MSTVLLGSNRFVDCTSILAYRDRSVLRVVLDPLRVDLTTPEDLPSGRSVSVGPEHPGPGTDVRVVATSQSFAVFWQDHALVLATLLDADTVHLKLDLRPLGINIYDDHGGLHIGTNVFARNTVASAAVAINLGD